MKKSRILGVILGVMLLTGIMSGCSIASNRHDVNQEESVELDGASGISIEAIASEIEIIVEDRDDVEAEFEGTIYTTSSREPELIIKKSGNDLEVYIDYIKKNINVGKDDTTLVVYIPESFDGDLTVDSISGEITIPDMILSELIVESVSGEIYVDSIEADYTNLDTVSGDIIVKGCVVEEVIAESVSGEINIDIPESAKADIDTDSVSGKIRTEDGEDGDITIEIEMNLSTVSGDISVGRFMN